MSSQIELRLEPSQAFFPVDPRIDVYVSLPDVGTGIRGIQIKVTEEGVIIDAFNDGDLEPSGTSSETYEEIHERLTS